MLRAKLDSSQIAVSMQIIVQFMINWQEDDLELDYMGA